MFASMASVVRATAAVVPIKEHLRFPLGSERLTFIRISGYLNRKYFSKTPYHGLDYSHGYCNSVNPRRPPAEKERGLIENLKITFY